MDRSDPSPRFRPWPDGVEPAVPIEGYPSTWDFTPAQPLLRVPVTRTDITGPADLWRKLPCGEADLATASPGRTALGALMRVFGRVLDEAGRPVRHAVVELWQANAAGRYRHALDQREAPLDPDFVGHGRIRTDEDGRYDFLTIKPGAYPVPVEDTWWRPPHLHFSVLGPATLSRLVTQIYFPGDPLNDWDRILNSVPDPAARGRLVARQLHPSEAGSRWLAFHHDLVLRGALMTPEAP